MDALRRQIGGDHYRETAIQPIEYVLSNGLGFCEGNVIKYVSRWKTKGGVEDLLKAKHYLEFLIEMAANDGVPDPDAPSHRVGRRPQILPNPKADLEFSDV